MIAEVAQRIEHLRQREVRQPRRDLFGRQTHAPALDNRANWGSRALDDRLARKDGLVADDVGVFGGDGHVFQILSKPSCRVTPLPVVISSPTSAAYPTA